MPDVMQVRPTPKLAGSAAPPGAKSATVRAVLAGALADGTTHIVNGGAGDNIRAMVEACRALGAVVETGEPLHWTVEGVGHALPEEADLDAGNSGIVLRVLAAVGARMHRCTVGTSNAESLGRRSNRELVAALRDLGADCAGRDDEGCAPLTVGRGAGLRGGRVAISSARSSQFLTGLLFLAPLVGEDLELVVPDTLSAEPMVRMTVDTLAKAGITVAVAEDRLSYGVAGAQRYRPATFEIPSDASSVAGLVAAAAAAPCSAVTLSGFAGNDLGTLAMFDGLRAMGVEVERGEGLVTCRGAHELRAIEFDGSACPDSILPMAALACFAQGTSVFYNVETMRYKECDRISDFRAELLAAGADVDERQDALIVHGRERIAGGAVVNGRHDHSVVMALAAVALRSEGGLAIGGWRSVGQTYRAFFEDLRALGAEVEEVAGDDGPQRAGEGRHA